jgi:hypothetical protein
MGGLLKIAAALIVEELRASLRARARRAKAQRAHVAGPPATTVQCDRCGASVPAHDIAMAAHHRACPKRGAA